MTPSYEHDRGSADQNQIALDGLDSPKVWDTALAFDHLYKRGLAENKRAAERHLQKLGLLPPEINADNLRDERNLAPNRLVLDWAMQEARRKRNLILFVQLGFLPNDASPISGHPENMKHSDTRSADKKFHVNGRACLFANDSRGARYWLPLPAGVEDLNPWHALVELQQYLNKPLAVFPHGDLVSLWSDRASTELITLTPQAYAPRLTLRTGIQGRRSDSARRSPSISPHLQRLESESMHIIREAVADAENPVMLYSIGKDSGVMLHLARKAFYPAPPPFPLLHVDTRWKFREMYLFRDWMAQQCGMRLEVYTNPDAIEKNINPFDHGSSIHTDITKTVALRQALTQGRYDVVFGGARRDEEKSRAKERIFSFRTATHQWDPKQQRPELWNLYNTRIGPGESIRVFPLSNWTELDIWQYIYQEAIPVVPLYFAQPRPVVVRPDITMLVDDERCRLLPGEHIQMRKVRFRTLGCYPLTGAIDSDAETLEDILLELIQAHDSERQGRKIDTDSSGSMEKKKQEGYF